MRELVASGATFVARTHASQVKHMREIFERAMRHPGVSAVGVLSECVVSFKGAFDAANPKKGGRFVRIEENLRSGLPEDGKRHDVTDREAALRMCDEPWPGRFGVFYEVKPARKESLEQERTGATQGQTPSASAGELLKASFERMR